jgi:RNA polymerase-binding transcription factor DksA
MKKMAKKKKAAKKVTKKKTTKKTVKKKAVRKKTTKKRAAKKATSTKSRFSADDLKMFRQLLLEKRAEILGSVASMKDETLNRERSDLSNVPFHMADAGSDNFELENTLGLMDEEVKLIKEIDAALVRIELGVFGICEGSDKPIPKARLMAIPWARYRVEYKELLEKGLVQPMEKYDNEYDNGTDEDEDVEDEDEEDIDTEDIDDEGDEDYENEDEEDEDLDAFEKLDEHLSLIGDDQGDDEEDEDR